MLIIGLIIVSTILIYNLNWLFKDMFKRVREMEHPTYKGGTNANRRIRKL